MHPSSQGPVANSRAGIAYAGDAMRGLAALAQRAEQVKRANLCDCAPKGMPCMILNSLHLASHTLDLLPLSMRAVPLLWDSDGPDSDH